MHPPVRNHTGRNRGKTRKGADSTEGQISGGASLSDSWAVSGELFAIRNWQGRHFSQATLHGEVQYYLADECTAQHRMMENSLMKDF